MPGIYFSDDVKIISHNGEKCILVPRAYFGKEKGSKDSPIVLPIKCDKLKVGDYISHGWSEGLVVANSETGTPYIRPASQTSGDGFIDEEKTTLVIIPRYITGRIHKLYNRQHDVGLFIGVNLIERKRRVTDGAIIRLKSPGDVVRVFKRGGIPEEEDRFFVLLWDGRIEEAKGIKGVMNLYTRITLPAPFEIIRETVDEVHRRGNAIVKTKRMRVDYYMDEKDWIPIG